MVTLTPRAAKRIRAMASQQGKPAGFLRVKVTSGGCSGLSYSFELSEQSLPGDLVTETDGSKVAVDPASDSFIKGSSVDYVETLMSSGFEMTNPLAKASCSCGTSFSVEDAPAPKEESFEV